MIGTTSARVAIHQATSCGRETREHLGGGGGSTARVAHAMSCGAVLAVIERCTCGVRNWLLYAYAAPGYPDARRAAPACQAMLYAEYASRYLVRAEPERMIRLAAAAMEDMRRRYQGLSGRGIEWYQQGVGFKAANRQAWVRSIERMLGLIDEWDARGLSAVAAVLPREAVAAADCN